MTQIGDIIEPGQPIPDDVTELGDRDTVPEVDNWGRWIRTRFGDWEWCMTPGAAETSRNGGGEGNDTEVMQRSSLAPYHVLAVRESAKPLKLVLYLPEIPDELRGAGALIGKSTGDRYVWQSGGVWKTVNGVTAGWEGCLGHILEREGGSVTVELPEPRTVLDDVIDLRTMIGSDSAFVVQDAFVLLDRIEAYLKAATGD